jgi:hypothetical protein
MTVLAQNSTSEPLAISRSPPPPVTTPWFSGRRTGTRANAPAMCRPRSLPGRAYGAPTEPQTRRAGQQPGIGLADAEGDQRHRVGGTIARRRAGPRRWPGGTAAGRGRCPRVSGRLVDPGRRIQMVPSSPRAEMLEVVSSDRVARVDQILGLCHGECPPPAPGYAARPAVHPASALHVTLRIDSERPRGGWHTRHLDARPVARSRSGDFGDRRPTSSSADRPACPRLVSRRATDAPGAFSSRSPENCQCYPSGRLPPG